MRAKLKRLSGQEVIKIMAQFGFVVHSQRGSHVKLGRFTRSEHKQTLRAIFRQAWRHIPADNLRRYLLMVGVVPTVVGMAARSMWKMALALFGRKPEGLPYMRRVAASPLTAYSKRWQGQGPPGYLLLLLGLRRRPLWQKS